MYILHLQFTTDFLSIFIYECQLNTPVATLHVRGQFKESQAVIISGGWGSQC